MTLSYANAALAIYESLHADNQDIDIHITNLKQAMANEGIKEFEANPEKLSQNNRDGRKMMQSYFKKRGVKVIFAA